MQVNTSDCHPLQRVFSDLANGTFPSVDLRTEAIPGPEGAVAAALAFTGHCIIAADVDPSWVIERCPPGDLLAALSPAFLVALGERVRGAAGSLDVVFCAAGVDGEPELCLRQCGESRDHPRVQRSMSLRRAVAAYETPDGAAVLTVGRGLAGRWEAGFEVAPQQRNRGLGRSLVAAARHLVPPGELLFMQVAPGNIASIRAVLAGGFQPVGAEVLFHDSHQQAL
jgi:hypothetical protein